MYQAKLTFEKVLGSNSIVGRWVGAGNMCRTSFTILVCTVLYVIVLHRLPPTRCLLSMYGCSKGG